VLPCAKGHIGTVVKSRFHVFALASPCAIFSQMNTAQDIEAAIRMLSPGEREKLIRDLPSLLPELDGDMAWNRIIGDTRARPGLTALLDQVEAEYKTNPAAFPEIKEKDFDRHS
jgi:hypothetical protein